VVGRGDTVWPELFARLDDAGYGGWLTVDPTEHPDRSAAAAAALAVLR
jgi:sugar phosphate isomerase/epimerase